MNAALDLLRLYGEWGVDVAVGKSAQDHRRAYLTPLPAPNRPTVQPRVETHPTTQPERSSAPQITEGHAPPQRQKPVRLEGDAPPILPQESIALARAAAMQAETPHALKTAIEQFEACSLSATAMHTLFPEGPHHAPLMIIGEAPDTDEDRNGTVFSGAGGALLSQMLKPIGLERAHLLVATALPWRPPGGRPPTETELQICQPFLERAIALLAPQRLLLCGRLPTRLLTGSTNATLPRQAWHPLNIPGCPNPVPAMVIRHPRQLTASPTARKDMWHTLLVVAQTLQLNS